MKPAAMTALMVMATGLGACATQLPTPAAAPAIGPLAFLYGEWSGTALISDRSGGWIELTQTERVGPMVDGAATVIEGRGYGEGGDLQFNAFAIASPMGQDGKWEMRSYTGGSAGTFPFEPKPNGFVWSTPAGPNAITRYTATITGDRWDQIGEYVPANGEAMKIFEMHLTRLGPTGWPSAGFVGPDRK